MPSARGSIRSVIVGAIVAVCGSSVHGDNGAATPSPATRPAQQSDGAVQKALRNLYIVPKAAASDAEEAPQPAWRGSSSAPVRREEARAAEAQDENHPRLAPRWSPNLAAREQYVPQGVARKISDEGPSDADLRSAGLGEDARGTSGEWDRPYAQHSFGGYRGFGEYGYGRQGYADYRRTMRWPGYSVEGYDAIRGPYRENFYTYGDNSPYGAGGSDYGYFEFQANARTEALLSGAITSRERGLTAFHEGRYREAVDHFRLACENNQGDPAAQLYAGHALFAIGRYRDGVRHLRRALELQPKIAYLTYDMRDDYRERGEFDRQLAALQDALRLAPRDEDRLFMLGYVLYFGGQRDRAYSAFARLAHLNPRDSLARRMMEACQPADVVLDKSPAATRP